jgi:hypothetical protein
LTDDDATTEEIRDSLAHNIELDEVGLWTVIHWFEISAPEMTAAEVRRRTLVIVRELHSAGWLEAGDLGPDGRFVPWGCSTDATLYRIDEAWDSLPREPSINDVAWFYKTASLHADLPPSPPDL